MTCDVLALLTLLTPGQLNSGPSSRLGLCMPGGTYCACGRRLRDCTKCGACPHGVLRRRCTEGCASLRAAPRAVQWQPPVVYHVPVASQPAAAAAAAAEPTLQTVAAAALLELGQPAAVGSHIAGAAGVECTPLGAGADSADPRRWVVAVPALAEMPAVPTAVYVRDVPSAVVYMRTERVGAAALLDLGQPAAMGSISTSAGAEGTQLGAGVDSAPR